MSIKTEVKNNERRGYDMKVERGGINGNSLRTDIKICRVCDRPFTQNKYCPIICFKKDICVNCAVQVGIQTIIKKFKRAAKKKEQYVN